MFVITLSTGIIAYQLFANAMISQIANSRVDVLDKISENMGTIKRSMSTVSNLYYYNKPMNNLLTKDNLNPRSIMNMKQEFSQLNTLYATALMNEELHMNYVVAMNNGFSYSSSSEVHEALINDYKKKLWYLDILHNKDSITWVSTYDNILSYHKDLVFSAARTIENDGISAGIFLVNLPEKYISATYEKLITNNSIYVIDQNGKIVSHHDEDMVGFHFYNMRMFHEMFGQQNYKIIEKSGEKYLFSKLHNDDFDWIIVEEIPLKILLTPLVRVRRLLITIVAILLVLGTVISLIISRRTSRPLIKLCDKLEQVGHGEEDIDFDVKGWYEIHTISEECNAMVKRIHTLVDNVRLTEHQKRKAELDFLQMQINPHFMYNTLFSIKCLVAMNKNQQAEKMLSSFILFLKSILSTSKECITIREELAILRDYVYIQKHRFGNKFDMVYTCSEKLEIYKIPKLLLQPLVENAILHGIEPKAERGRIEVVITQEGDDLMIKVIDDGVGVDINQLNGSTDGTSIGIYNVADRIRLNYGEAYGLHLKSQIGMGMEVAMLIPMEK